ncbi:MAG: hypothetical protein V4685_07830 [Bacteroidota bacterium]
MKKTFLFAPFILLLSLFFVSCEREISFENGGVPGVIIGGGSAGGSALYSFDDGGTASCTGATISGIFTAGTATTAANTVTLDVTVDSVGSWIVSTSAFNGISFSGSGTFTTTGAQSITLNANGTPTTAGTFNFTPGPNNCAFSVTVAPGVVPVTTAVYSFNGGTSSCTGASLTGTLTAGTAATAANTVVLQVTVDTIGTYSVTTTSVNGIVYSGSGTFTTTGANTITLTASGTPTAAGDFNFVTGSSSCTFSVSFAPGSSSGTNFLRCKVDGTLTNYNTNLTGFSIASAGAGLPFTMSVFGTNSDVSGSIEELRVNVQNPTAVSTGAYVNGTFSSGLNDRLCQAAIYPTGFPNLYWGSSAMTANTFTVTINEITTAGAKGTFGGTIYESNGLGPTTKQVTEGEFQITF